jgi:clan AA aspartic protease (TIGR02281 family)
MERVTHSGSTADRADAYGFLMLMNAMSGHFRSAMIDSEERLKARGASSAPDGFHALLSSFGRYADLAVVSRRASSVPYERAAGPLLIPVSINGGTARYILDTGANFSVISESEAKRLGLKTSEVHAHNLGDSTGTGFSLGKVAVADRMEIGNSRLKNVPFMVVGDDLDAFGGCRRCAWRYRDAGSVGLRDRSVELGGDGRTGRSCGTIKRGPSKSLF